MRPSKWPGATYPFTVGEWREHCLTCALETMQAADYGAPSWARRGLDNMFAVLWLAEALYARV